MSKFGSILIVFFISKNVFALTCNSSYVENKALNISLSKIEMDNKKYLSAYIGSGLLSLSEGDYVIVQNIANGSDSINIEPKISDPKYTEKILQNLITMKNKISNDNIQLPAGFDKKTLLSMQSQLMAAIQNFLKEHSANKNWNLFNSFLFYETLKIENDLKFKNNNCGMTGYELTAIEAYTGGLYKYINKSLRTQINENSLNNLVKIFNRGLDKLEPYKGLVTRGASLSEPYLSQHKLGNIVLYLGLTSTSKGEAAAFTSDYKFSIQSEYGRDISEISMYPDEREVLFKPTTNFHIDAIEGNEFKMSEVIK